jgi:hypothetical protein
MKKINKNNNNEVPAGTKNKAYSAVASPKQMLPDDGPCAVETSSSDNKCT